MRNRLQSALFVDALVLAASVIFLLAHLLFGLGNDYPALNVSFVLAGIIGVGLLLFVLLRRTLQREMLVRRFYLSHDWIYNHEIGYAPLRQVVPDGNVYDLVTFIAEALAHMSYGFEVAGEPASFAPCLIIESDVFLFHAADADGDDSDGGVVVDSWEGVVRPADDAGAYTAGLYEAVRFANAGELATLLKDLSSAIAARDGGASV